MLPHLILNGPGLQRSANPASENWSGRLGWVSNTLQLVEHVWLRTASPQTFADHIPPLPPWAERHKKSGMKEQSNRRHGRIYCDSKSACRCPCDVWLAPSPLWGQSSDPPQLLQRDTSVVFLLHLDTQFIDQPLALIWQLVPDEIYKHKPVCSTRARWTKQLSTNSNIRWEPEHTCVCPLSRRTSAWPYWRLLPDRGGGWTAAAASQQRVVPHHKCVRSWTPWRALGWCPRCRRCGCAGRCPDSSFPGGSSSQTPYTLTPAEAEDELR